MNREDFLASLKSDEVVTGSFYEKERKLALLEQMRKEIGKGNKIDVIGGVFGEWKGCDGYLEKIIEPPEGGRFMKIYGCSYLFKGYPSHIQVHGLELAKSLISEFPREIIAKSFVFSSSVLFMFLFARRRFIEYVDFFFRSINIRTKWYDIPPERYNVFTKEIKRAVGEVLKTEQNPWGNLIEKIVRFLTLVLECDAGYRFRLQDSFGNLEHDKAKENGVKEFFRLLDIQMGRETVHGVAHKWVFIKRALKFALWTSPTLSRIVSKVMVELDPKKLKMDEADWYYCLRYKSYDFRGNSMEWRFKERDRIDKLKGHVILV